MKINNGKIVIFDKEINFNMNFHEVKELLKNQKEVRCNDEVEMIKISDIEFLEYPYNIYLYFKEDTFCYMSLIPLDKVNNYATELTYIPHKVKKMHTDILDMLERTVGYKFSNYNGSVIVFLKDDLVYKLSVNARDMDYVALNIEPINKNNLLLILALNKQGVIEKIAKEEKCDLSVAKTIFYNLKNLQDEIFGLLGYWLVGNLIDFTYNGLSIFDIMEKEHCSYLSAIFSMSVIMKKPEYLALYKNNNSMMIK